MRFALLKKGLFTQSSPEFLDISVILPDNASLGTFLSSCERMGMDALMTNSHPLEYSNDRYGLNIQFDIRKADLTALTLFLEGSHIRYDILGVYNILN